jgi:hypothetical protein
MFAYIALPHRALTPIMYFIVLKIGRWIQHFEPYEILTVKATVTRQQPICRTQCMCTD